jgi:deazaflavin-dependent oxidoreductase (nitroreductase family)
MATWEHLAGEYVCHLTTIGRVSGLPRRIEIWFAIGGPTLYILSGGRDRADWVRNARRTPEVGIEIDGAAFRASARAVRDGEEDERARRLVHDKYAPGYGGGLERWRREALPMAFDLLDDAAARGVAT